MLTLHEIVSVTGGAVNNIKELSNTVTGFSIDSRTLKPGNVFVALQGETYHGNEFAPKAISNGAVAVLTDKPLSDISIPFLMVPNSLTALRQIAAHQRFCFNGKLCGVTGTVGKTSVKEALGFLIHQIGLNTHISEKSYNNHIGVPLTLANLGPEADIAVVEMGTNHPGEILPLSQLSHPHVSVVTAVGPGHIEFFNSVLDIAKEKISIAAALVEGGIAVLPKDSEYFGDMSEIVTKSYGREILSFGSSKSSDIQALSAEINATGQLRVSARVLDTPVSYILPTFNYGWVNNSLAILAAVYALGLDVKNTAENFYRLPLTEGRGRIYSLELNQKRITLIDDAYNANPLSMTAALETLTRYPGRKFAIIGDMRELGNFSQEYHAQIGKLCNHLRIDKVLTCGSLMKYATEQLSATQRIEHIDSYTRVMPYILDNLEDGDVLLLKASNGVNLHKIVSDILNLSKVLG